MREGVRGAVAVVEAVSASPGCSWRRAWLLAQLQRRVGDGRACGAGTRRGEARRRRRRAWAGSAVRADGQLELCSRVQLVVARVRAGGRDSGPASPSWELARDDGSTPLASLHQRGYAQPRAAQRALAIQPEPAAPLHCRRAPSSSSSSSAELRAHNSRSPSRCTTSLSASQGRAGSHTARLAARPLPVPEPLARRLRRSPSRSLLALGSHSPTPPCCTPDARPRHGAGARSLSELGSAVLGSEVGRLAVLRYDDDSRERRTTWTLALLSRRCRMGARG